jgi:hypothetical protein
MTEVKNANNNIYTYYSNQCPARFIRRVRRSCDVEILKVSSDGDDSGSKKCNKGMVGSGGRLCVGTFSRNLASIAVNMFFYKTFL